MKKFVEGNDMTKFVFVIESSASKCAAGYKEGKQRSAVNITISGIGGVSIGDNTVDAEDVEPKSQLYSCSNKSTIKT